MARIPQEEIERLKREVSLVRLVEASGVKLERRGEDFFGRCVFHDGDEEPSLSIHPERNVFHCFGCGASGNVVDWVMRRERVSFRHAVEILRRRPPPARRAKEGGNAVGGGERGTPATSAQAPGAAAVPGPSLSLARRVGGGKLVEPLDRSVEDEELLREVVAHYHASLKESPEALGYLEHRGLVHPELIARFHLGYANRTLAYRLPEKATKAGEELRGRLQRLGVLRASGHEHLNGRLVIPILGERGEVVQLYGRVIRSDLRKGTPDHLYLPGPLRGVFNREALEASREVILCEALIDALTFWCAGLRCVTSAYGVSNFTEEHFEAFRRHGIERVLLAFDRDERGEAGAQAVGRRLQAVGIGCWRVEFPRGMDANDYARKVQPAAKGLELVLRHAEWMGNGAAPVREARNGAIEPRAPETDAPGGPERHELESGKGEGRGPGEVREAPVRGAGVAVEAAPASETAAAERPDGPGLPAPGFPLARRAGGGEEDETQRAKEGREPVTAASAGTSLLPQAPRLEVPCEVRGEEVAITLGDRRYRVRGLAKNLSYDLLKVNVLVSRGEGFHVDTLDLYAARVRAAYAKQAAAELGVKEEVVQKDLGKVLLKLEELQEEAIRRALEPQVTAPAMSAEEREEALALLRDPRLLDRILEDFGRCGVVGEETNKLTGYLAAVSRKLAAPLAVLLQSSSAAGKTALMDAILSLVPEEERVKYSAMTGQSLFYMTEQDLKHKVLALVEEEGAERATYALKLLQSEGELTIASTGKDPQTGRLVTHEYRVEGPVAILLTTTRIAIDEELLNRCLVLTVDEDREQTRRIHELQRERRTLEGVLARSARETIVALHRNAQRLLRPLAVVNPYAPRLTFQDSQTRTRRDHEKYLTLIDTVALLHQHQREVRRARNSGGREVEYVEVALADIEVANRLAHQVLGRSLDELPPQTRRLLELLDRWVEATCRTLEIDRSDVRFQARQVREETGWGPTQVKVHLQRLVELEYLVVHRAPRGQGYVYELLYDGEGEDGRPFLPRLIDVKALEDGVRPEDRSGSEGPRSGANAERSGSGRPPVGPRSGGGRGEREGLGVNPDGTLPDLAAKSAENASREGREEPPSSYVVERRSAELLPLARWAGGR